jgi:hypothetical protein
MKIYTIPGKMEGIWREDVKAMVDTWTDYFITLDEFKEAVLIKGVSHAAANGGVAWIVDSSQAKGVFKQEIQAFIGSDIFPAFANAGIKYFITITSQASAMTQMTVSSYSAKAGPNGLQLLEVNSVEDAVAWLKENE